MERRTFSLDNVHIEERALENGSKAPIIRGHAAVFDLLSEDLGGFREKIAPGAFKTAILEDDVRALFNHDPNYVLGRKIAKTLRMTEDERGLAIEIDPPDTQVARDLLVSMSRGDITQMSFGFSVVAGGQSWEEQKDGSIVRTISNVRLFDVSPVTYPAYPQTDVAVRSLEEWKKVGAADNSAFQNTLRKHSEILNLNLGPVAKG